MSQKTLIAPTIDDIRAAARVIYGAVEHTPTRHSDTLSRITGVDDLVRLLDRDRIDRTVTVAYLRGGRLYRAEIQPGERRTVTKPWTLRQAPHRPETQANKKCGNGGSGRGI